MIQFSVASKNCILSIKSMRQLAKSNIVILVPAEMSMLEAKETAGVKADFLCRGDVCGRCELDVLETGGVLMA